jgi:putative ABC transport system ATP-binding protein
LNHFFGLGDTGVQALVDVELELSPGEFVILSGPTGSGKTTLLLLIGGLLAVQQGSLRVLGTELRGLGSGQLLRLRRQIGFIFARGELIESLTAAENVAVTLRYQRLSARQRRQLVQSALSFVGLERRLASRPNLLSLGERQRVAIARAVVANPPLILADEPTTALDWAIAASILELLGRLARERGSTILMITHDPRAFAFADRIIQLADGKILAPTPPSVSQTADRPQTIRPELPAERPAVGSGSPGEVAFSSLTVTLRYPAPIAIAYRRFLRQKEPAARLSLLLAALEALLRYLVTLGLADLFACHGPTEEIPALQGEGFTFLREPVRMQLGLWARALRELAAALAKEPDRFLTELPSACGPGSVLVGRTLEQLLALRNKWAHPPNGIPLTPQECEEVLREARPLLEQALQQVQFVSRYPLGFAKPGQFPAQAGGRQWVQLHSCTGFRVANTNEAYTLETTTPLPINVPFVIAPEGRGLLCLWPWLAQKVSDLSVRHTLYRFDGIPDRKGRFLAEVQYVALDGREEHRHKLTDTPAHDLGWLRQALERLPCQALPSEPRLYEKLLHLRGGQLVNHRVGRYRLLSVVAVGGFGTVYAAENVQTGERVAIKVLERSEAVQRHLPRFTHEFAILQKARQHPHIIRCLEDGCEIINGQPYPWYAMEFAGLGDLADRIAERVAPDGKLPWHEPALRGQIIQEFQAIADAVAYLHEQHILHRDVKPGNVLILDDGTLRLSDFGLGKSLVPDAAAGQTSTGAVLGTPDYMAGEQARGETVDARADVYALGVLLAEMATGLHPRPATFAPQGSTLHGFSALNQLPRGLRRFVLRCTDADPQHRPADGGEVRDLFLRAISLPEEREE